MSPWFWAWLFTVLLALLWLWQWAQVTRELPGSTGGPEINVTGDPDADSDELMEWAIEAFSEIYEPSVYARLADGVITLELIHRDFFDTGEPAEAA